jgi:hypothetical protein
MAVRAVECLSPDGTTCIEQQSSTKAADGTTTTTQNACFSDGTKTLEVDTYPPGAPPMVNRTIQILRNGLPCGTFTETSISGSDEAGDSVQTDTEVVQDSTGNMLATILTVTTRVTGGGTSGTATITCVGQPPEPFDRTCLYGGLVSCANGTCM